MDKSIALAESLSVLYPIGQLVLSIRGKDRGTFYVVVGFDGNQLALVDAKRFNVSRPKRKNAKHVQRTSCCATGLVTLIEMGKNIDHGCFCQFLAGLGNALNKENEERRGRAAYGKGR